MLELEKWIPYELMKKNASVFCFFVFYYKQKTYSDKIVISQDKHLLQEQRDI